MTTVEYIDRLGLWIKQPKDGYRYNEDSFLLIDFLKSAKKNARIIDLGAGCGIISLCLAQKFPESTIVAVEILGHSYDILKENIRNNGLDSIITPVHSDYRNIDNKLFTSFDIVITNPPYRSFGIGRINPALSKATARHETHGTLEEMLAISQKLLKDRGRFLTIYLTDRLVDLIYSMRKSMIEPKIIRHIYPNAKENSHVTLMEGIKKGGKSLTVLPCNLNDPR